MNDVKRKHYVVIGGGITGLSAAYYLQKGVKREADHDNVSADADVTLIELNHHLGGKIQTTHREGFVIEKGPDSFLARKLPIIELSRELGLEQEFVSLNPNARVNYILHYGRLHRMPPGLMLGIPTQIKPFMQTDLISYAGKARAALDLVLPRRAPDGDESLGGFISRRLGKEVLENIAEPLLSGIYAGDTYKLSVQATFPQFPAVERKFRSIILGMLASKQQTQKSPDLPDIAKQSLFLNYNQGFITLVHAIERALTDVQIKTGLGVESISTVGQGYRLTCSDGSVLDADGVIVTLPAHQVPKLFGQTNELQALNHIQYVSVANVVMAFDLESLGHPLNGSGFLVPRNEGKFITACTWTSSKWLHTAPKGKALIRCYIGRSGDESWQALTDEALLSGVMEDLRSIMGLKAKPLFYEVTRLPRSMPQYPVGHLETIKAVRSQLAAKWPGVHLAGAAYEGVGVPDCIRQGREAAEKLLGLNS